MEIPYEQLNSSTLQALIEEFVTRNGTDYGENEVTMEEKVDQVMVQLKTGKSVIVFDAKSQSCNIVEKGAY